MALQLLPGIVKMHHEVDAGLHFLPDRGLDEVIQGDDLPGQVHVLEEGLHIVGHFHAGFGKPSHPSHIHNALTG